MKNPTLIRNETTGANTMRSLVCNLLPNGCRHETLEGLDYVAVPMVMMTEGVHHGSDGPLLYPSEELAKVPAIWNQKPVVVYHPEINGKAVSACDPDIVNRYKVGVIMNASFENKKLKAEAWIRKDRADLIDTRILSALNEKPPKMMELSIGVFADNEKTGGDWNGEKYSGIARNYRADHLALLPDKIGACSILKGAGFLRNQAPETKDAIEKAFSSFLKSSGLIKNEMSYSNIQDSIAQELRRKIGVNSESGPWLWVVDVYSNFAIYEYDGRMFAIGYTSSNKGVSLSDELALEVKRETNYRTVEGALIGNQDQTKEKIKMDRKKAIDGIIANKDSGWVAEDRPALEAMTDARLEALSKAKEEKKDDDDKEDKKKKEDKPTKNEAAPTTNATAKTPTFDELLASADPATRELIQNGINDQNQKKANIIDTIVANKNNVFTKEELGNRPLGELEKMARLCASPEQVHTGANYTGRGGYVPTNNTATGNVKPLTHVSFDAKK